MKNVRLLRCAHHSSLRRTKEYALLLMILHALHPAIFEQPLISCMVRLVFCFKVFNPIVWQPRRVYESGAGSLCCLSTRMCEFMTTPLSSARRGNPDFTSGRETPGRLFFGSFLWSEQRNERIIFLDFDFNQRLFSTARYFPSRNSSIVFPRKHSASSHT